MNSKPFFSIIIPNFNKGRLLKKAVDSVLSQTYKNWECIIVDNFSSGYDERYLKYISRHSSIKVLYLNNNGIIARSRNLGIKSTNVNSDWICFLDSDDSWKANKLEEVAKYSNSYDFIFHSQFPIPLFYLFTSPSYFGKKNHIISYSKLLNNGNIINTSSVSVRKISVESVGLFNEGRNFIAWEDFDLWLRLAKVNIRFKRLSKFLGFSLYGYKNVTNPKTKLMTAVNFSKIYFPNFLNHNLPAWNIYSQLSSEVRLDMVELFTLFKRKEFDSLGFLFKFRIIILAICKKFY
tara:strand:+ start:959 stop:1834 length:876 start_codon:yes stop_codon:yes gene_type:complete